jgi:tryptophan synthase
MTDAIVKAFDKAAAEKRTAFIPYVTAGYPTKDDTVPIMLAMEKGGADVIELGVPFSDPQADGPTIQAANFKSLEHGTNVSDCLEMVITARAQGLSVPVVLMGYYNPFVQYGEEKLVSECAEVGVHGFIVVDLLTDSNSTFIQTITAKGLCFVPLVAPTTTEDRMKLIASKASGYVYCVSLTGVTGARTDLPLDLSDFIGRVKKHFSLPLVVGFGISTREHVKEVGALAEGVVMGSAVVKQAAKGEDPTSRAESVFTFCKGITAKE